MKQVADTEAKSCGLWCDSRQDFPFVNLLEVRRERLLCLCCPPSSTQCSQGITISPRKQPPPEEAHQRPSRIWAKKLTQSIKLPVSKVTHGKEICGYFWNRAADAWAGRPSPQQGKGREPHPPPPHCPLESVLTSVLGLQGGLCKHTHRSVGLERRPPEWFSRALASLQLSALNE